MYGVEARVTARRRVLALSSIALRVKFNGDEYKAANSLAGDYADFARQPPFDRARLDEKFWDLERRLIVNIRIHGWDFKRCYKPNCWCANALTGHGPYRRGNRSRAPLATSPATVNTGAAGKG